MLLYEMNTINY